MRLLGLGLFLAISQLVWRGPGVVGVRVLRAELLDKLHRFRERACELLVLRGQRDLAG